MAKKTASAKLIETPDPVLTSVGMYKKDGLFHVFVAKIQSGRVIDMTIEEGDLKSIATESLKINVMKQIIDQVE